MSTPPFAHLTSRTEQGVLVLTVNVPRLRSDDFDLVEDLRRELLAAVGGARAPKVALDLSGVEYFGSAGFRPLLSLHRKVHGGGGHLIFCNLTPDVAEVFLITRLVTTSRSTTAPFEMAPDLPTAVSRLAGA